MGMTIPGMSVGSAAAVSGSGNAAKAGGSAAASTEATASGAAAIFGQSLQQIMGTMVSAAETVSETPANPLLAALQQLIAAAGQVSEEGTPTGDGDAKQLEAKVDDLLTQLDSLDEQLEEHPEMLEMLQGWIQQAQTVLNPHTETSEGESQTAAINTLASNPATLKFALQDTVVQLIDLQKNVQTAPEVKALAQQALTALQQTVEKGSQNSNAEAKPVMVQKSAEAVQVQETGKPVKNEGSPDKTAAQTQVKAAADSTIVQSKNQAQQSGAETHQGGERQEAETEIKPQGTITAGELALRANGMTPAKPIEAVPVQRVPQEVAKLAVDRLEILQKEGFTEAKISLTPDHLGKVDIRLTMHAGQLVAHFVTEHAMAKDMLEQQMVQLRGTLQNQGITVERIEVTQSSSLQSQMDQNSGQPGGGQQQERRARLREEANDDARLTAELGEELGEWLRQKTAAQTGSSFVAEA